MSMNGIGASIRVDDLCESLLPYVATTANIADFFTKPLAAADFYRHRNCIMNVP